MLILDNSSRTPSQLTNELKTDEKPRFVLRILAGFYPFPELTKTVDGTETQGLSEPNQMCGLLANVLLINPLRSAIVLPNGTE